MSRNTLDRNLGLWVRSFQTFRVPPWSWVFIYVWYLLPVSPKIPARVAFSSSLYLPGEKIPSLPCALVPGFYQEPVPSLSLTTLFAQKYYSFFFPLKELPACFLASLGFHIIFLCLEHFLFISKLVPLILRTWLKRYSLWNTWIMVTRTTGGPRPHPTWLPVSCPIMGLRKAEGCVGPRPGSFLSTKPCAWHMARAQQILIWDMNESCSGRSRLESEGKLNWWTEQIWSPPESSCSGWLCWQDAVSILL